MATVVPLSDEDPALVVVRFTAELAWADGGAEIAEPQVSRLYAEAEDCMVMGRWLDLASLMLNVSRPNLECIFTVICNLVTRTSSLDEALEVAKLVSAKLLQQPGDKPSLRLKILFNLYNLLENPYSKFFVYTKALDLAISGKVTDHVIPTFKRIDSFLRSGSLRSMGKESLSFLIKYLGTFSTEDAYVLSEAKEEAARAIIEFVKSPDMFQVLRFAGFPAVGQLEKDPNYTLVYELLRIFLTQRLDAYLEFHSANSTLLKSYGLVHEDCVTKMRLVTLADLGSYDSGEIPYSLIKESLAITDDEVEYWVVKAIAAKLIDCKMDQMNQSVIVSRTTERVFGLRQWKGLRSKLGIWRGNVMNMINTIQASRSSEEAAVAM
ncbi:unnamed protein product [Spirodela intermedia]|uniref:Eukaryotic translation initiation factor 3 subunit M n=1 Tax=Spirodela intermedia TaxID=51605 RepID=A0A7I8JDM2_SPIIN|nr:unnamed protein product [Spirodela intermedia]CAA6668268.1 unnamed protein product [Spirodela intermedia]